jgi:hypothetical protein
MTTATSPDDAPAVALLDKVRTFAETLSASERELFAVLIGPGVEALMSPSPADDDDEVSGFSHETTGAWKPGSLRSNLATAATTTEWQLVERR